MKNDQVSKKNERNKKQKQAKLNCKSKYYLITGFLIGEPSFLNQKKKLCPNEIDDFQSSYALKVEIENFNLIHTLLKIIKYDFKTKPKV